MRRASTYIVLALVSCSSDQTTQEVRSFSDGMGRECQATVEKTSPSSPVLSEKVACGGASKTCSGEARACFQLSPNAETAMLRNCPACCKGASSSFVEDECSPVICETALDCVYRNASCEANRCICPNGYCDD